MSFKKIKSLFITEDEEPAKNTNPEKEGKPEVPPVNNTLINPPVAQQVMPADSVDARIFESLQKAIEAQNKEGFDYLEFRNALKSLTSIIPDEATRFRSAFVTASAMGLTINKLLESGQFYKQVLDQEKEKFKQAVQNQLDSAVLGKQKEIEKALQQIQQKQELIQKLTQEIQEHQQHITSLQTTVTDAATKIEVTRNNFDITWQTVYSQIEQDLVNIQRYIQQAPTA